MFFLILLLLLPLNICACKLQVEQVDNNTVRIINAETGSITELGIHNYGYNINNVNEYSPSVRNSINGHDSFTRVPVPQPVSIDVRETTSNRNVKKYVAWLTITGGITVSLITAITALIQHFTEGQD